MKSVILFLCIVSVIFSQIEKFANDETYTCVQNLIIKPDLKKFNAIKDEEAEIINGANYTLANSLAKELKESKVIELGELSYFDKCNSKVYLLKIETCNKLAARMGQNQFEIRLKILEFSSIKSKSPSNTFIVEAIGKRHWGTKEPLQSTIKKLAKKIRKAM